MGEYRKKPVVINAWLVKDLNHAAQHNWGAIPLCIQEAYQTGKVIFGTWIEDRRGISILTLEGKMFADPDDWIIQGIKGEIYPCKPDVFEATYEGVTRIESTKED